MGSIRGEGTPPINPSRHLKKERILIPLKWLLKEDQGRRPTAASAATAAAPSRAAAVLAAETATSPCLVRYSSVQPSCRRRRRRQIAAPPSPPIIPSTSPNFHHVPLHGPPSPSSNPSFPVNLISSQALSSTLRPISSRASPTFRPIKFRSVLSIRTLRDLPSPPYISDPVLPISRNALSLSDFL